MAFVKMMAFVVLTILRSLVLNQKSLFGITADVSKIRRKTQGDLAFILTAISEFAISFVKLSLVLATENVVIFITMCRCFILILITIYHNIFCKILAFWEIEIRGSSFKALLLENKTVPSHTPYTILNSTTSSITSTITYMVVQMFNRVLFRLLFRVVFRVPVNNL